MRSEKKKPAQLMTWTRHKNSYKCLVIFVWICGVEWFSFLFTPTSWQRFNWLLRAVELWTKCKKKYNNILHFIHRARELHYNLDSTWSKLCTVTTYYYCLAKCHQGIWDEILILKIALHAEKRNIKRFIVLKFHILCVCAVVVTTIILQALLLLYRICARFQSLGH